MTTFIYQWALNIAAIAVLTTIFETVSYTHLMTTYLKQSLRAAEAEYARLGRLYQSSGMLVGALLVVLFL